jgi:hypothetical protein
LPPLEFEEEGPPLPQPIAKKVEALSARSAGRRDFNCILGIILDVRLLRASASRPSPGRDREQAPGKRHARMHRLIFIRRHSGALDSTGERFKPQLAVPLPNPSGKRKLRAAFEYFY